MAVEAELVRSVDCDDGNPSVRLANASVSLHHNELAPNFVVEQLPLVEYFLEVVLCRVLWLVCCLFVERIIVT